jgi:hypothetical protein
MDKDLLGLISVALAVAVTIPYLWKICRGQIQPHVFTWLIWTLTTSIAAAARTNVHAGPGAWGQWASGASCFLVVLFAFTKGTHDIKRSDIFAFIGALLAIPVWILTKNPLAATLIVTTIDVIGYYPTLRKSYQDPYHEAIFNYCIANVIHLLSLAATKSYSVTSTIFPTVIFCVNTALIIFVLWRRRVVKDVT